VGARVVRADVPGLDGWLAAPWVSLLFTVVAVGAVTHAFNVIDGFNGLASMSAALILAAVGYVAVQVGDWLVLTVALGGIGALLGFWFWNWPRGVIFLGDGGAYLTGFWVAEAVVLLVVRNNAVSPWFAVMVLAYPVTELLFSIWRKWRRGRSPMQPDGVHLHMLIFRRLVRWSTEGGEGPVGVWWRNAMTSPYLWALTVFSLLPAMLWWRSTPVLVGCVVAFVVGYGWMYRAIVRFRGQRWLRLRG
ncbi:MAG TPA: glycosyltransferase, partial [Hydrogenophilus thermoluteolus]|nr:glycosyltransferase [Hydrogenophilus thermoluteolus]